MSSGVGSPSVSSLEKYQNDILQFLVVLKKKDMNQRCLKKSYKDRLLSYGENLQGHLHYAIIGDNQCICCRESYAIQDIVNTRKMYVKLPKEKIYVGLDKFDHEYTKSQTAELIYIFRKLGAKEIKINVSNMSKKEREHSLDGGLSVYGIDASIGYSKNHVATNANDINIDLTFDDPIEHIVNDENPIVSLFADPKIHYLKTHSEWYSFVKNRVHGNAKTIDFKFIHTNGIQIDSSLKAQLDKIKINYSYNESFNDHQNLTFHCIF